MENSLNSDEYVYCRSQAWRAATEKGGGWNAQISIGKSCAIPTSITRRFTEMSWTQLPYSLSDFQVIYEFNRNSEGYFRVDVTKYFIDGNLHMENILEAIFIEKEIGKALIPQRKKRMSTISVCGNRDFTDKQCILRILDYLKLVTTEFFIIHSAKSKTSIFSKSWSDKNKITSLSERRR